MSEQTQQINLVGSDKLHNLIDLLKGYKINNEGGDSRLYGELREDELRDIFYKLNHDEKLLVLYEAVLTNAVCIADSDRKLEFFRTTEKISTATWLKKVLITSFAFTGVVAFSTFIFMMVKNGALNDISFVASFLKTISEVLNVIFLTK